MSVNFKVLSSAHDRSNLSVRVISSSYHRPSVLSVSWRVISKCASLAGIKRLRPRLVPHAVHCPNMLLLVAAQFRTRRSKGDQAALATTFRITRQMVRPQSSQADRENWTFNAPFRAEVQSLVRVPASSNLQAIPHRSCARNRQARHARCARRECRIIP
jgi:hypothetical protein